MNEITITIFLKKEVRKYKRYYYYFVIYNSQKNMIIGNYPNNIGKKIYFVGFVWYNSTECDETPVKLGSDEMHVSYKKLWKLLIDRNMRKQDLREKAGISKGTITKLGKNQNVSTETLAKICAALDCNIEDIVEFSNEE